MHNYSKKTDIHVSRKTEANSLLNILIPKKRTSVFYGFISINSTRRSNMKIVLRSCMMSINIRYFSKEVIKHIRQ